jgi:hypothetical protein
MVHVANRARLATLSLRHCDVIMQLMKRLSLRRNDVIAAAAHVTMQYCDPQSLSW